MAHASDGIASTKARNVASWPFQRNGAGALSIGLAAASRVESAATTRTARPPSRTTKARSVTHTQRPSLRRTRYEQA
ncbi:MAG: hypothetical protein DCC71_03995 [Proteobacteria bacterium]|nr:MAG: hypothetical protein DCC71_03995 [Pseudomonadota bacterium]